MAPSDRSSTSKPVLFVTGHAPLRPGRRVRAAARAGGRRVRALRGALAARRCRDRTGGSADRVRDGAPFPHRRVPSTSSRALAASALPRGGRAPPAAASRCRAPGRAPAARACRCSLGALWAHPRTAAHALSYLALRRLYRTADAVVDYGPHVEAYVRARGARNVHVAPQAVDNAFWARRRALRPPTPRGRRRQP